MGTPTLASIKVSNRCGFPSATFHFSVESKNFATRLGKANSMHIAFKPDTTPKTDGRSVRSAQALDLFAACVGHFSPI